MRPSDVPTCDEFFLSDDYVHSPESARTCTCLLQCPQDSSHGRVHLRDKIAVFAQIGTSAKAPVWLSWLMRRGQGKVEKKGPASWGLPTNKVNRFFGQSVQDLIHDEIRGAWSRADEVRKRYPLLLKLWLRGEMIVSHEQCLGHLFLEFDT